MGFLHCYISTILLTSLTVLLSTALEDKSCQPWTIDAKPRIFVLTDINNEPDDAMSLVRLLLHADMYRVEGLAAVTSYWKNETTEPEAIIDIVETYKKVHFNLQTHSYYQHQDPDDILSKIAAGSTLYGTAVIDSLEAGNSSSSAANLLVHALDASSEPLYIQCWGGANVVAEALWLAQRNHDINDFAAFMAKMRVYSISDQDNAGWWVRTRFPGVRWVSSTHGWNVYQMGAWLGMSGEREGDYDFGGPNSTLVSNEWLDEHVRLGPLGSKYPRITYAMEGDTPSLLPTFITGLSSPEHPEWGSWGGRYAPVVQSASHFADTVDTVIGKDGRTYRSNKATVWRWRDAVQAELAARIQWTLAPASDSSHTAKRTSPTIESQAEFESISHPPVVVINGSCGNHVLSLSARPNSTLTLDARASYESEDHPLSFTWWHYREPSLTQSSLTEIPLLNFTFPLGEEEKRIAAIHVPIAEEVCKPPAGGPNSVQESFCRELHVVLEVKREIGAKIITRYRRVIVKVEEDDG